MIAFSNLTPTTKRSPPQIFFSKMIAPSKIISPSKIIAAFSSSQNAIAAFTLSKSDRRLKMLKLSKDLLEWR
jgi:hypothetical protein